jgi:UrcA family protein
MRKILSAGTAFVLAAALFAGSTHSQQLEEILVTGVRIATETQLRNDPGSVVTLTKVSVSYGVSYEDLNLATPEGAAQLKARVRQAAEAACRELDRQYPLTNPKGARCVEPAVDEAMPQVRRAIAAVGGASKKQ